MCEWMAVGGFKERLAREALFVHAVFVQFLESFDDQGMVGFEHFDESGRFVRIWCVPIERTFTLASRLLFELPFARGIDTDGYRPSSGYMVVSRHTGCISVLPVACVDV